MADGSKVEDLNVLREGDHLFFVWRQKQYLLGLHKA